MRRDCEYYQRLRKRTDLKYKGLQAAVDKGMSQAAFARSIGVSRASVTKYLQERGIKVIRRCFICKGPLKRKGPKRWRYCKKCVKFGRIMNHVEWAITSGFLKPEARRIIDLVRAEVAKAAT